MDVSEINNKKTAPKKAIIMAGGTGGHVMPALAVAEYLQEKGIAIHWLGTRDGIESRLVPQAGFPITYIEIEGLRGKKWQKLFLAPWKILKAVLQSYRILKQEQADMVLSMGGYVAGPGAIAAWLLKRPVVLHEQNAVAGWTNRILAKIACRIMVAFPQAFQKFSKPVIWTGNPLRKAFLSVPSPDIRYEIKTTASQTHEPLRVLVLGGSQGALSLNELIPQAIAQIPIEKRPQIWHQTGNKHLEKTRALYNQQQISVQLSDFIDDMVKAYVWADVVICRAGALTIAEIAAMGVASILVPFPYAVDDHQTLNAKYLSDEQAAILMPQSQLNAQNLSQLLIEFIDNPTKSLTMAKACQSLAKPTATRAVAEQCLEVICGT